MIRKAQTTLADVAREAGVSVGAAGKVLNGGSPRIGVGEATRKRILEVAARLRYRRNIPASTLAGGKSHIIGVLIDSAASYRNQALLAAIENAAARRGYTLLIGMAHDSIEHFGNHCRRFTQYDAEATLIISHDYYAFREKVIAFENEMPEAVFFEKPYNGSRKYIATSRQSAFSAMVADAVRNGKNRIAILHAGIRSISEQTLLTEYSAALAENQLSFIPELAKSVAISCNFYSKEVKEVVGWLKEVRPDVLYVDDADYGVSICSSLIAEGWHLPEDLQLVGGNDSPFFQRVMPAIPSFSPQYDKIAEALLNKMGESAADSEPITIEAVYHSKTINPKT